MRSANEAITQEIENGRNIRAAQDDIQRQADELEPQ